MIEREKVFALLVVTTSIIFSLLISEFALREYQRYIANSSEGDPGLLRYDSQLGWSLSPGWSGRHQHYDFDVRYTINEYGFRGTFPENISDKNRNRIAIIGDSFSFGLGVNDKNVFVEHLNDSVKETDYMNLSVPGYSTDQQLLLLKRKQRLLD